MPYSTYLDNKELDHLFGKAVFTAPSHIYVGLSKADPLADGSGVVEPSDGSYVRVETDPADWSSASGGVTSNVNDIVFPVPTGDWGLVTHGILYDAVSGGNFLGYGTLNVPKEILTGPDAAQFPAGDIVVTRKAK